MDLASMETGTIAVVGGLGIAALWIFAGTIEAMTSRWQRERSRREIAAYIAEGSITPEEGERLMADKPRRGGGCW